MLECKVPVCAGKWGMVGTERTSIGMGTWIKQPKPQTVSSQWVSGQNEALSTPQLPFL